MQPWQELRASTHKTHSMAIQILSVSYDQALLLTRQLMLEGQGYQVVSALGFKEAERKCKDGGFQLMVLGHSIPFNDKQALLESFASIPRRRWCRCCGPGKRSWMAPTITYRRTIRERWCAKS